MLVNLIVLVVRLTESVRSIYDELPLICILPSLQRISDLCSAVA